MCSNDRPVTFHTDGYINLFGAEYTAPRIQQLEDEGRTGFAELVKVREQIVANAKGKTDINFNIIANGTKLANANDILDLRRKMNMHVDNVKRSNKLKIDIAQRDGNVVLYVCRIA